MVAPATGGRGRAAVVPKSVRTRQRILDAAAAVLSSHGYSATRIADVAAQAAVHGPAIYYHFASRDELIEEVIATGQRRVIEHVSRALAGAGSGPLTPIVVAAGAHVEFVLSGSTYASASIRNFSQLPPEVQARQVLLRRRYGAVWRELFEAAESAGAIDPQIDVHAARMLVLGSLNWTTEWWESDMGSLDDIVGRAQRFVAAGLAAGAAPLGVDRPDDAADPGPAEPDGGKGARTRRRALEAAARVLGRRGYAGTRLADVAAEADVQAASLYYHFASRDELVEEVVGSGVRRVADDVTAALARLPESATHLDRLDRAVQAHLTSCLAASDFAVAAIRNAAQLPPAMAQRTRLAESEYADVWRRLLEGAAAAGELAPGLDLAVTRMLVLGALNQAAEWIDPARGTAAVVRTARVFVRNAVARGATTAVPRPRVLAPVFRPPGR